MQTTPLIILGSARKESDTGRFVKSLFRDQAYSLLDLMDYHIAPYSYAHNYPAEDDFLALSQCLLQHKLIIFATPVYWYSMSGPMKNFFDRLTDLITVHKSGRQLRGRKTALLAVGSDDELPDGFTVPFESTSCYLGMEFLAAAYAPIDRLEDAAFIQEQRDALLKKLQDACKD